MTNRTPSDTLLEDAIIAMAEDGWLFHGPEGMSEAQEKCYAAYLAIKQKKKEASNSKSMDETELCEDALHQASEAFLDEWEEYFGEEPRGAIADNISTLLEPAILSYLNSSKKT